MSLSPDALTDYIVEEIIVTCFSSAKPSQIWSLLCDKLKSSTISPVYKSLVWSWLTKKPEIEIYHDGLLLEWDQTFDFNALCEKYGGEDQIDVCIEESKQWIYLTSRPKEGNPIGSYPFILLKYIISRKEQGISQAELAKVANQDPRSLSSRLSVLEREGLIIKQTADIPGISTSLIIHKNYIMSRKETPLTLNRSLLKKQVVETIKDSQNRIRTQRDVAAEFGFVDNITNAKKFRRLTRRLCTNGFLKPVLVAPAHNDNVKTTIRALMYVKDYQVDAEDSDEDEDDIEEDDDEDSNTTNVLTDDLQIVENAKPSEEEPPLLNSLFPIMSCVSEIIRQSKDAGVPAMDITRKIVGKDTSWFLRLLYDSKFVTTPDNEPYDIVRALDSEGKVKFYRYFIKEDYAKLTGDSLNPKAGKFPDASKETNKSLVEMSLEHLKHLGSNGLEIVHCDDMKDRLYWSGTTDPLVREAYQRQLKDSADVLTSTSIIDEATNTTIAMVKERLTAADIKKIETGNVKRKRGRKLLSEPPEPKKPKINLKKREASVTILGSLPSTEFNPQIYKTMPESTVMNATQSDEPVPEPTNSKIIPDFANLGGTIKSQQRRKVLLSEIDSHGGMVVMDAKLARDITDRMNSISLLDKSTLKKDAVALKDGGLIDFVEFAGSKRGEDSQMKTLLISLSKKPTERQVAKFIENFNNSTIVKSTSMDPEVFRLAVDFKNIAAPKSFSPSKPFERKLTETKPTSASIQFNTKVKPTSTKEKKTSKKKTKTSVQDIDPMMSYLSNVKEVKRKIATKKTSRRSENRNGKLRDRTRETYDSNYIIAVAKAHTIVSSLAPNKAVMDWASVGELMGDNDGGEKIKRKWPYIRRHLKHITLPRIKDAWDRFLNSSIRDGSITYEMLVNLDYKPMYELWSANETDDFGDEITLYTNYEHNFVDQKFVTVAEENVNFQAFPSSLEKIRYLSNKSFSNPARKQTLSTEHDEQKAVLKSIFMTEPDKFDSSKSRKILAGLGDYFPALKQLELCKEIAYLGENSDIKFTIPEKTWLSFQNKINTEFLQGATKFVNLLDEVVDAEKALILSPMTPDHTIAVILHLFMEKKVSISLVDKNVSRKLSGYFTRNLNRQLLETDIVISKGDAYRQPKLIQVALPIGSPCSRIWVDMNGDLRGSTWKTIVSNIVHHIYFKPGIDVPELYELTHTLLALFELHEILKWLKDRRAITETKGFYVLDDFYTAIGS